LEESPVEMKELDNVKDRVQAYREEAWLIESRLACIRESIFGTVDGADVSEGSSVKPPGRLGELHEELKWLSKALVEISKHVDKIESI
jgi:hypothetical protein